MYLLKLELPNYTVYYYIPRIAKRRASDKLKKNINTQGIYNIMFYFLALATVA